MPPTRRRPAILALHATRRPSRQTSSRLEASPLSSTFVAFSIRSPPFLELRRSRARAAHRRALRRPPLTVLPPICCALGRLASPRTCSTPSRAGPSPCSCARGAAARHQRRRAPASVETPSPAAPNLVRTHQWVALDLLMLIHPSITAGEHPTAGIGSVTNRHHWSRPELLLPVDPSLRTTSARADPRNGSLSAH